MKTHKDPLGREVDEALRIEAMNGILKLFNSKGEWNSGGLTRLTVEKSTWETKKIIQAVEDDDRKIKKKTDEFKKLKHNMTFVDALIKLRDAGSAHVD